MPNFPFPLGPYRLERALGRGGMGVVYEAYDTRLERRVAVKRLRLGSESDQRRERLRREAKTTAKLAHPAIVQVFDLVEDSNDDWIVMELVDGKPLAAVLKEEGPLDPDTTLGYARQIAEGLAAAHQHGIVHRDLKAENVMILKDGRVKILDFGIAKLVGPAADESGEPDLSKTGEVIGTSRAMAPEQARGLGVSPRSDLFALGVLLYETLTGVSPFRAATPMDTLARVITHQPQRVDELAPGTPPELTELVERLLRKAPELRPSGAREVAEQLTQVMDDRRAGTRVSPKERFDEPPTQLATASAAMAATEWRTSESSQTFADARDPQASPSTDRAFRVSPAADRRLPVAALAVGLAAVAWWTAVRSDSAGEATSAVTASAEEKALGGALVAEELAPSQASSASSGDPSQLYEGGMSALRRIDKPENVDHAIEAFRRLIERDPSSAAAQAGLARAYWEKSRSASGGGDPVFLDQALAMAQEAVRLNGYLADARTSLGLALYSQGQHDEARTELEQALDLEPTHADAVYGLGKLAETLGHLEEAEELYRRAGELRPTSFYFDALGSLHHDLGRYDLSEAAFEKSLKIAPDNINALRNLGGLYYSQGRIEEASVKFQAALRIRPNASLFSNLGTLFFSRGLYSKAATAFEDALRMDGAANRYIYWLNLADAYRQIPGKSEDAALTYRRAFQILDDILDKTPSDTRARSRRALALARAGDPDRALGDIEVLRRSEIGGDLYSLFRLGVAEELCGERDRALSTLEAALRSGLSLSDVRNEPDLQSLRADPDFHLVLVELDTE